MEDLNKKLLEQVYIYWKRNKDNMTLSQITDEITDEYLENNSFIGFDIPTKELLSWLIKRNEMEN
jgi:hypothetical protein